MNYVPKVAIFIDGHHLYYATRSLGFDVDYRNLLDFVSKRGTLLRGYFYSAVVETEEYSPLKPLTDWLAYNGYTLVTKPAKEFIDSDGRRRIKGNMDVEMAVDMMELAPHLDEIVLVTGKEDFVRAVNALKRLGIKVSVMSTLAMTADELRRAADEYLELRDIAKEFTRRSREVQTPATPVVTPANPFGDEALRRRKATA